MIPPLIELDSVAVFGSVARGDQDKFSDRDILLVSDDNAALAHSAKIMERDHWSCSCYSWQQMDTFRRVGALFVEHLKSESLLLRDTDNRLREYFDSYSPNNSYHDEIVQATDLLCLLELIPESTIGKLWALDVLMVGFRCLAIATLANEGKYHFSLPQILDDLCRMGIINNDDKSELRLLRKYKRAYRNNCLHEDLTWHQVFHLISIVDKSFKLGLSAKRASAYETIEAATSVETHNIADWYCNSRKSEAALLCIRNIRQFNNSEGIDVKRAILHRIKNPSHYSSYFKYGYSEIRKNIMELANEADI